MKKMDLNREREKAHSEVYKNIRSHFAKKWNVSEERAEVIMKDIMRNRVKSINLGELQAAHDAKKRNPFAKVVIMPRRK